MSAKREIGVTSSCSIVCLLLLAHQTGRERQHHDHDDDADRPGQKEIGVAQLGIEEDASCSILIGGLRIGGAGWSGSSTVSSSVASSLRQHAGAVERRLRQRRHACRRRSSGNVVCCCRPAAGVKPFGITSPSRALPVCSHVANGLPRSRPRRPMNFPSLARRSFTVTLKKVWSWSHTATRQVVDLQPQGVAEENQQQDRQAEDEADQLRIARDVEELLADHRRAGDRIVPPPTAR